MCLRSQKQQNVYHIAVKQGQLKCMELLIAGAASKRERLIEALKAADVVSLKS